MQIRELNLHGQYTDSECKQNGRSLSIIIYLIFLKIRTAKVFPPIFSLLTTGENFDNIF